MDECSNNPCKNGGTCINSLGGFSCKCQQGFKGALCDEGIRSKSVFQQLRTYPSFNPRQSTDSKVGLMLGKGRGRRAVFQILKLIQYIQLTLISSKTCFLISLLQNLSNIPALFDFNRKTHEEFAFTQMCQTTSTQNKWMLSVIWSLTRSCPNSVCKPAAIFEQFIHF